MNLYYVATIARYDFVWADNESQAKEKGEALFNDIFHLFVPVRTVRLATEREKALFEAGYYDGLHV